MMKFKLSLRYLLISVVIFIIEVLIATVLKHVFFVRAYLGDVIVVILIYTLVKSFFVTNNQKLVVGIFVFSCLVEFAQYFNIAEKMGFQKGSLMYIIIGNSFSWIDIVCYAVGCLLLYFLIKIKELKSIRMN
ncbi:hypothetical protein CHRY9393_00713 [Chryseobacterium fistulae]|uniref:DUF2809 domain-containing protein n=2 Tax=Chryseobacterium fistulae TaxID=2675058 RepID=A0A6N4XKM8_9FLAO|nr:hypothetical protein CHRY9393_00713 [Chryseobacterium fistulae]